MSVEDRKNRNCAAHNRKINIVDMDYVGEVKNILSSILILENSCCPDEDVTFTHTVKALGALAGLKE